MHVKPTPTQLTSIDIHQWTLTTTYSGILNYLLHPIFLQIKPSDVEFWSKSFADMQLRHKRNMYPPRVKITIRLRNHDAIIKLPVKFSGHVCDNQLDVDLTVPLGRLRYHSMDYSVPYLICHQNYRHLLM